MSHQDILLPFASTCRPTKTLRDTCVLPLNTDQAKAEGFRTPYRNATYRNDDRTTTPKLPLLSSQTTNVNRFCGVIKKPQQSWRSKSRSFRYISQLHDHSLSLHRSILLSTFPFLTSYLSVCLSFVSVTPLRMDTLFILSTHDHAAPKLPSTPQSLSILYQIFLNSQSVSLSPILPPTYLALYPSHYHPHFPLRLVAPCTVVLRSSLP